MTILPKKLVDYDVILSLQTLSWEFYDTEINFDLANHDDFDIHVSLLYDVQNDNPEDYTGIRVGYPASANDRIGFLTPPGSPRKFKEETIDELVSEATHQYIGNIEISPIGTDKGIKQTLSLKNATSISTLSIVDSPIMNELGKIFDATEWIDQVKSIDIHTIDQKHLPNNPLYTFFDKHYFFDQASDDVYFDYEDYTIYGDISFHYKSDEIKIEDGDIYFYGGLEPTSYEIRGIGESSTNSNYITVHLYQDFGKKVGMADVQRKGSFRIYLLVSQRNARRDYESHWIFLEYGFGEYTYMRDYINSDVGSYMHSNFPGISVLGSLGNSLSILNPLSIQEVIPYRHTVYSINPYATICGLPIRKTTGTVTSTKIYDEAEDNNYTYGQLYMTSVGLPNIYPNDFNDLTARSLYIVDTIASSIDYKITPIITTTHGVGQASW